MENLIPIVNKLQDVFSAIEQKALDLPQIVVIGSQSSGKSSVIEAVVGRDFLPRGSGIVTRRPLVLQLFNTSGGSEDADSEGGPTSPSTSGAASGGAVVGPHGAEEWGEFLHLPGQKFTDFAAIRSEIERETDRVTGSNKGISSASINLRIYSPYVLNLTLVDLPGITKVPVGDQPRDIEERIRSMCMEFITNPNAIILAVSAANQDLANSDGLKMAQSVDPDGDRTVGVLTKVDIMDHGTDCVDILNNKVIPLKKGYVAVVNRSQADIQKNLPIREGIVKEQQYFLTHPRYRSVSAKCGTTNLARTLNQILMKHIKEVLPAIKARIAEMIAETDENIAQLGEMLPPERLGAHLLKLLSEFSGNFMNILEVKSHLSAISTKELYGGARIAYIFKEHFGKGLTNLDALENLSDDDIRTVNANSSGLRPALLMHEMAFDLLVRKQIAKLEAPALQCVDYVFDELLHIADLSCTEELKRFPRLNDCIRETVYNHLRGFLVPTQSMISNIIQAELGYLNTSHPDFIGGKAALGEAQRRIHTADTAQSCRTGGAVIVNETMSPPPAPSGSTSPAPNATAHSQQQPLVVTPAKTIGGFTMISGSLNLPAGSASAVNVIRGATNASAGVAKNAGSAQPAQLQMAAPTVPSTTTSTNASTSTTNTATSSTISTASGSIRLKPVPEVVKVSAIPTERERLETEVIKILMDSYFGIVKKNVVDLVPKIVMRFLVNSFSTSIQNHLVSVLYSDLNSGVELLREKDDLAEQRGQLRDIREMLQRAIEIINEVRDYHVSTASA